MPKPIGLAPAAEWHDHTSPAVLTAGWKSRRTVPCSRDSMPLSALAAGMGGMWGA